MVNTSLRLFWKPAFYEILNFVVPYLSYTNPLRAGINSLNSTYVSTGILVPDKLKSLGIKP